MIDVWVGNLGKYNDGELSGEWVKLPTTPEKMAEVFERIGIDNVQYEEHFLADWESDKVPDIHNLIGEYSNLDELNYLAALLEEVESDHQLDEYNLLLYGEANSLTEAINLTQSINEFSPNTSITDYTNLGYQCQGRLLA